MAPVPNPQEEFARLAARPEAELPLDRAALLIACTEYAGLDPAPYLEQLDRMAQTVAARLPAEPQPYAVMEALSHHLYGELGFQGNQDEYYDPRNSFLNDVLERRKGIPITLSTVYMEVGRRLGVPLVGIGMPGHFLVRYPGEARGLFIDCFHRGVFLTREDCRARLRELFGERATLQETFLQAVSKRTLLYRMLNNLKGIYLSAQRWEKLVTVIDWMRPLAPDDAALLRDRGLVEAQLGRYAEAQADLEAYLDRHPEALDAGEVRRHLAALAHRRTRIN